MSADSARQYFMSLGGTPPVAARVPEALPATSAPASDPRRHFLSNGGPPNHARAPEPTPASTAAAASAVAPASAPAADAAPSRQYYLSHGVPEHARVPATSAPAASASNRQFFLSGTGPPNHGRAPTTGSSAAPAPAPAPATPAPITFAPQPLFQPVHDPAALTLANLAMFLGISQDQARNLAVMYGIPLTTAAPPAQPTSAAQFHFAQPAPRSSDIKNPNSISILHPTGGYCTFALLPKGAGAADEQLPVDFPSTSYWGHPESSVEDLIRGLYGETEEQVAKDVGIAVYEKVDGVLRFVKRWKVGEEAKKRCGEVGWKGDRGPENPVILAWGRGPVRTLPCS